MKTQLATIAAAALLSTGVGVATAAPTADHPMPKWTNTPCEYEDSVNCYWDAGSMGNGSGHSFIVRQVPGKAHMVCVFYTQRKFARHHDYCS